MTTIVRFTAENILDYPAGSKVVINSGAYYPQIDATVVGFRRVPADRFTSEHFVLQVAQDADIEGEDGEVYSVRGAIKEYREFSKGIGLSLREVAKPKSNPNSPWAK